MFRVGEIFPKIFLSQNVEQLSVKRKLDHIRDGCKTLKFSDLVMWKNSPALQITVPMFHF